MCITGRYMELWETMFAECGKVKTFPCYVNDVFHWWNDLLCSPVTAMLLKRFAETRSQLRYGAVSGDWGPSTNKQFCKAKSQSVYHSALLASFVWVLSLREVSTLKVRSC